VSKRVKSVCIQRFVVPFSCSYEIVRSAPLIGLTRRSLTRSLTRGLTILLICEKLSPFGVAVTRWPQLRGDVSSAISSLIVAAERRKKPAAEASFAALYSELRRLAKRELAKRGLQASLSATTLLHEAYLHVAAGDGPSFPDRARFMGYAARVMRGLIIDHARERHA
jgi:hypothetical protein